MATFKTVCKSSLGKLELTVEPVERVNRESEWIIAGKFVHPRAMVTFTGIALSDADIKHVMVQNAIFTPMYHAVHDLMPEVEFPQLSWHKNAMGGNCGYVVTNSNIQCDLSFTINVGKAPVKVQKEVTTA